MLFTTFGLIFGPVGLGIFSPDINNQTLRTLADLTLALKLVFKEIGTGIAVGLVLTFLGGWLRIERLKGDYEMADLEE